MLKFRHYLKEELKITFYLIIVLTVLSQLPFFEPYNSISWFSMLFFFFFHLIFGYYASRSLFKPVFISIFIGGIAVEFFLSMLFVYLWSKVINPIDNIFVVPFFIFFAIYKIFSTSIILKYFMQNKN